MGSKTELGPEQLKKSQERVLKEKEKALIEQFSDKETRRFIIKPTGDNDLDIAEECITLEKLVGMGGQFFAFQAKIDWNNADSLYKIFFINIAAHEMARKDSLEEQLGQISWQDFDEIDINNDLKAELCSQTDKSKLTKPVKYMVSGIKRSGVNNYLRRAIKSINSNDLEFIDYLKKRGILIGHEFNKETIKKSIQAFFKKQKLFKEGKSVIKVSRNPDNRAPRNKREQNYAGVPHMNFVYVGVYGLTVNKRTFYLSDLYKDSIFPLEMPEKLSVTQKLKLGYDISRAVILLKNLHAVDRDIKPENIMTDGETNKLLDLALSNYHLKEIKDSVLAAATVITNAGEGCFGTPGYMAPEQAKPKEIKEDGKKKHVFDVDIRADIYGLGGVLYYLFTGEVPNVGDCSYAIIMYLRASAKPYAPGKNKLKQIKKAYLKNLGWKGSFLTRLLFTTKYYDNATKYAEDVVLMLSACLDHDREKRYQTPEEMHQDIGSLMEFKEPENAINQGQNLKGAFYKPKGRKKYYLRKAGRALELAGIAAAGITYLMPDLIVKYLPEQVFPFLEKINLMIN